MKSFTTPDFWQAYAQLTLDVKEQAQQAYQLWQENPLRPSYTSKRSARTCGLCVFEEW